MLLSVWKGGSFVMIILNSTLWDNTYSSEDKFWIIRSFESMKYAKELKTAAPVWLSLFIAHNEMIAWRNQSSVWWKWQSEAPARLQIFLTSIFSSRHK